MVIRAVKAAAEGIRRSSSRPPVNKTVVIPNVANPSVARTWTEPVTARFTGRFAPRGAPVYVMENPRGGLVDRPLRFGRTTFRPDLEVYELGAGGRGVAKPGDATTPKFATNAGVSIVNPKTNQPYLKALMQQLTPYFVRRLNAGLAPVGRGELRRSMIDGVPTLHLPPSQRVIAQGPVGDQFVAADLSKPRIQWVANDGAAPGTLLSGRRIELAFDLRTKDGTVTLTSSIQDRRYANPIQGGELGELHLTEAGHGWHSAVLNLGPA